MSKSTSSSELFKNKPSDILPEDNNQEERSIEAEESEDISSQNIKALTLKAEHLEKENLTLMADMSNLRRRSDEDMKRNRLYSNQKIIESLLPALDVLELALNLPEEQHTIESLLKGCEMTQTQLHQILSTHGLEKIKTDDNTLFNPEEHEAIQTASDDTLPSQCIIQAYQSGYKLNGRVVRTAKVIINQI